MYRTRKRLRKGKETHCLEELSLETKNNVYLKCSKYKILKVVILYQTGYRRKINYIARSLVN